MSCMCEFVLESATGLGTRLCIKSFSTIDKHTDNAVYLNMFGKTP
jgi:hypothetical protein